MTTEILVVPDERAHEVASIIRAGLNLVDVSADTRYNLLKWCDELAADLVLQRHSA